MLLIQIGLTVVAWMRGWKALALLPMAVAFGIGFVIGFICGVNGRSVQDLLPVALMINITTVGALIAMSITGRKPRYSSPSW